MTATSQTMFHTCPVCGRVGIGETGGATQPVFKPHSDGIGHLCPMSGEPVPAPEVWTRAGN